MKKTMCTILTTMILIVSFVGCQGTATAVKPETMNSDETMVYNLLKDVEKNWVKKDFTSVFVHYADDGVFTGEKNAPASKNELIKLCQETSSSWKITAMDIKKLSVNGEKAFAKTVLKMEAGNNKFDHPENYELEKRNGTWLIVKEINP